MNTFPVNPENAVEMARLLNQHVFLSKAMGGVLVELSVEKKASIHDVLDLACGPGGQVLEIARSFPHMQVTGVDISAIMVAYGNTSAQAQSVENAHFMVMDIFNPLNFPDNSFDLVNGRLLSAIVKREAWSPLLHETFRICRPRGIMRLADWEPHLSSSPALNQLFQLLTQAYYMSGRGLSSDGTAIAVISHFSSLLSDAGFQNIQERKYMLDFSSNSPLHTGFYQDALSGFQVLKPWFIKLSLISETDFQLLYQQMLIEMSADGFSVGCDALIAWGEKP